MSSAKIKRSLIVIESLVGKVLTSVTNQNDEIIFIAAGGYAYKMYHEQDCCESVYVESINGNLNDLLNEPIIRAEERVAELPDEYGLAQATFYDISTNKGGVTIRWHGSSNGYYGVSVSFDQIEQPNTIDILDAVQELVNLRNLLMKNANRGDGLSMYDKDDQLQLANSIDLVLGAVKVDE